MNLATYFDAAASTPLDPRVREVLIQNLDLEGNNNSKHVAGHTGQKLIDQSLKTIAKVLNCNWEQLSICYSGTDANRRFIHEYNRQFLVQNPGSPWGKYTWGSHAEHSSVSDEILGQNIFDPCTLKELNPEAKLIALMAANSETGRIYEAQSLKQKFPQALILRDFSQHFAKYQTPDLSTCDAGVFTPQKFYGPKNIGILYLKNPENFPNISKDSHTKFPALIAASAKAFEIWAEERDTHLSQLQMWEKQIRTYIIQNIPDHKFHEADKQKVPGLINVAFAGVRGGELMTTLSQKESICISIGSACTSDIMIPTEFIKTIEPDSQWQYPIRISLHKYLSDEAVQDFCEILAHYVEDLRRN